MFGIIDGAHLLDRQRVSTNHAGHGRESGVDLVAELSRDIDIDIDIVFVIVIVVVAVIVIVTMLFFIRKLGFVLVSD